MMNKTLSNLSNLAMSLRSLTIFRNLLQDPVISYLIEFLDIASDIERALCDESNAVDRGENGSADSVDFHNIDSFSDSFSDLSLPDERTLKLLAISAYSEFVSALYNARESALGAYVQSLVNEDENVYIRSIALNKPVVRSMEESLDRELDILQEVAELSPEKLKSLISCEEISLSDFEQKDVDLKQTYVHRLENIEKYGYGNYSRYRMFYVSEEGKITPAKNPDPIRLSQLIDYEREKNLIIENTKALLVGKPASNMLLTGDAGTGKSSTIKAVVNEFSNIGLRIVEIKKEQLHVISKIMEELSENPLKFIIFIDDLSFTSNDDNFNALKAALEGSVLTKSRNVVIYATSNRRHLVKETFSSRQGDDVHLNDTLQEIASLSDRFGLHITFRKPDKQTYLNIVHYLAEIEGLDIPAEELSAQAEKYALEKGNRSARCGRQFIDICLNKA